MGSRGASCALGLVLVAACTDTGLRPVSTGLNDRLAIQGELCTTPPEEAKYPVRILFAVDSSDSMIFNDPDNLVVDSIEKVVERFRGDENVTFGIIRWGERSIRELVDYSSGTPALFTKDESVLAEAFSRMRELPSLNPDRYLGGTNYSMALEEVRNYLTHDLAANQDSAALHQYYIEFITDGMPQSGERDPQTTRTDVLAQVEALRADFSLRLDAISIVEIAIVAPEFFDLLPAMVDVGGGTYVQLQSPEALDDKFERIGLTDRILLEFELGTINAPDDPRNVLVINRNARIADVDGVVDLYADSDGDGLVDRLEEKIGTNPVHWDSDGDGLDDFFEYDFLGEFDPLAKMSPAPSQDELADLDEDGLSFYVENRIGSNPRDPDSDGDGIPDGIEYAYGSDPMIDDLGGDPDHDGLSVAFELRQHTHPSLDEGEGLRRIRSYEMDPVVAPFRIADGRRCYRYHVKNITLVETRTAIDSTGTVRPDGYNRIELWRMERPIVNNARARLARIHRMKRGETWVLFRPSVPQRDPPAFELRLGEVHFDP